MRIVAVSCHRERNWDGDIYSNLSDVNILSEFSSNCSIGSKDGCAVPVSVLINNLEGAQKKNYFIDIKLTYFSLL